MSNRLQLFHKEVGKLIESAVPQVSGDVPCIRLQVWMLFGRLVSADFPVEDWITDFVQRYGGTTVMTRSRFLGFLRILGQLLVVSMKELPCASEQDKEVAADLLEQVDLLEGELKWSMLRAE